MAMHIKGLFFNMVLLGSAGGDIVRAYDLATYSRKRAVSVSSILLWRLISILALLSVSFVASFLSLEFINNFGLILLTLALLIVACISIAMLASPRTLKGIFSLFGPILKCLRFADLEGKTARVYNALILYRDRGGMLGRNFVLALLDLFLWVLVWYTVAVSIGLNVPLRYFLLFVPLIRMVKMLPISVNGLGTKEVASVFLLDKVGVPAPAALSLSLLFTGLSVIFVILLNGISLLFSRQTRRLEAEVPHDPAQAGTPIIMALESSTLDGKHAGR